MHHLIRMRSLCDQLSQTELSQTELVSIVSQLMGVKNENISIQSVWNHAYNEYKSQEFYHENENDFVHKLNNEIIKRINEQRIVSGQPELINSNDTFSSIPNAIINNIGNFLNLYELTKTELVNRRFFISLRFPVPAIKQIDDDQWIIKYVQYCKMNNLPINCHRFSCVSDVVIDLSNFHVMSVPIGPILKSMNKLHLKDATGPDIEQFMSNNRPYFDKIEHFKLENIKFIENDGELWRRLILSMPNIKLLYLQDIDTNDGFIDDLDFNMNIDEIRNRFPNLVGIVAQYTDLGILKHLLIALSDQIKSIHINERPHGDLLSITLRNISSHPEFNGFPKLQELCLEGSDSDAFMIFFDFFAQKTLKCLNKLNIWIDEGGAAVNAFKQRLDELFRNHSNLKCIGIGSDEAEVFEDILETLEYNIMKYEREELTVLLSGVFKENTFTERNARHLVHTMNKWLSKFAVVIDGEYGEMSIWDGSHKLLNVLSKICQVHRKGNSLCFHTKDYIPSRWNVVCEQSERCISCFLI